MAGKPGRGWRAAWERLRRKADELKSKTLALYYALRHPKTGILPKLIILVTVAYAVSPVDLIPDFIPVLGLLDDIIILPLLVRLAVALIPKQVMEECMEKARERGGTLKKRWPAAIGIFLIWGLIFFLIIRRILKIASLNRGR